MSSSEFYDDANELLSKIKNGASLSGGISFGIGPPKVPVTLSLNVSGSLTSSFLNQLSKYNEKVLKHKVCVSQYSIIYTEHALC